MGAIVRRGTRHAPRFFAQYRDADGVRRTKLLRGATTVEHARGLLAAIELNVTQGRAGVEVPTEEQLQRASITVRKLGEKFLDEKTGYSNPKVKDMVRYRREAVWKLSSRINPRLGSRAVASLTVADLERFRDELLAARSAAKPRRKRTDKAPRDGAVPKSIVEPPNTLAPASVTRTLALLSKMFAWGRKQGLIDCESPTRGCVRPSSMSSLDYLERDEVARLLAKAEEIASAAPATYEERMRWPMVVAAIFGGMRKGELFGLTWSDVHLDASRIDVRRSYRLAPKSGKARHLPMHPELVRVLRLWKQVCPETKDRVVFPVDEGRGPRMGNERDMVGITSLLRSAGCHVPEHPWHGMRHTMASHYMMAGGNILELQKLLGHSTLAMTMVYAHLSPDHLAAGVARMTFAVPTPEGVSDFGEERRKRAASDGAEG